LQTIGIFGVPFGTVSLYRKVLKRKSFSDDGNNFSKVALTE
jgi:hypothetical protein